VHPLRGMLARERTCYLARVCWVRGTCSALLDSSWLAMGDRAATPCDRSLGCRATPSTYPLGMLRSLLGESAWLDCTTAELSASCLDPMTCAFLHPPFCYASACSYYCCVACLLCEAALIDPRSIEAPRTCSALWSAWHLQCAAALRLIYRIVEWHVRLSRGVPRICSDE
jgi:hypothetical protein